MSLSTPITPQNNSNLIVNSTLLNTVNQEVYNQGNKGKKIPRDAIISTYTKEILDQIWSSICQYVSKNYSRGRGTYIKPFGTFTFHNPKINLEGTTNQFLRDSKLRVPVFVISNEFNSLLRPGEYTKNGLIYYTQKLTDTVNIVKLNIAEISYANSISKEDCQNIIKYLLLDLNDTIKKGEFKEKKMPTLGSLILQKNIIGVKFDEEIINNCIGTTQTFNFTKKNTLLCNDVEQAECIFSDRLYNPYKHFDVLRGNNALVTKVEKSADKYLKNRYDINVNSELNNNNYDNKSLYRSMSKFDFKKHNFFKEKYNVIKENSKENCLSLTDLNIDNDILKNLDFFKGIIKSNMKKYDINNTGIISNEECIQALIDSGINKMDNETAKKIINLYSSKYKDSNSDKINYMKLLSNLVKDSNNIFMKQSIIKNNLCLKDSFNYFKSPIPLTTKNKNEILTNTNLDISANNNFIEQGYKTVKNFNPKRLENPLWKKSEKLIEEKRTKINSIQKEIGGIKNRLPSIFYKYRRQLEQKLSLNEFMNILKEYALYYSKEKIEEILDFIELNKEAFSLNDFNTNLNKCNIINYAMENKNFYEDIENDFTNINPDLIIIHENKDENNEHIYSTEEIKKAYNKIKDIIYLNGGKDYLFKYSDTVSCENFITLFKERTGLDTNLIKSVYYYIVKTDRNLNENDYKTHFENTKTDFGKKFLNYALELLTDYITKRTFTPEEFFDYLCSFNKSTKNKKVTRNDFINYMQKMKFNLSAEELSYLFTYLDSKKDNALDMDEFKEMIYKLRKPMDDITGTIREHNLEIEDLAKRLNINAKENIKIPKNEFKKMLRILDLSFSDEYIEFLFDKMRKNNNFVYSKTLLEELNTYKYDCFDTKIINSDSLNSNFIESFCDNYKKIFTNKISYYDIKKRYEYLDLNSTGIISKLDYVQAIGKSMNDLLNDDDHIKYARINNVINESGNIKYTELLDILYFNKKSDNFIYLIDILNNNINEKYGGNIEKFMMNISQTNLINSIPINKMNNYIVNNLNVTNIYKKSICKLDVDSDGFISFSDLKNILSNYKSTAYFKYENNEDSKNNYYPNSTLNKIKDYKVQEIINRLKLIMKNKGMNTKDLFNLLDKNKDGLISISDFNEGIEQVLHLTNSVKDQFFNYIDYYHTGLINYEIFNYNFIEKYYGKKLENILIKNNFHTENLLINEFIKFLRNNKQLTMNEIFSMMDKDVDGLINFNDFKYFIINNLKISQADFNDYQLERFIKSICVNNKKMEIGINDIQIFLDKLKNNNYKYYNEVFINENNNPDFVDKVNENWIDFLVERFGLYISEKYDNLLLFFNEYKDKNDTFTFDSFNTFCNKNLDCFKDGLSVTNDELINLFNCMDPQKKGFLTYEDFENKLSIYDFYKKMHSEIKYILNKNFDNGKDAFNFFTKNEELQLITKKEFFDGINLLFPNKYCTETILKYITKYFSSNSKSSTTPQTESPNNDEINITSTQFIYEYFDKVEPESNTLLKNSLIKTPKNRNSRNVFNNNLPLSLQKLNNSFQRTGIFKENKLSLSKSVSNFHNNNNRLLHTAFDSDPLNKIKRIVYSANFDIIKFFNYILKLSEMSEIPGTVNKFQFRTIIKEFNLGLTSIEIEQIILRCGMERVDNRLNINNFIKFLKEGNKQVKSSQKNISIFLSEIKQLLYKYYTNPIICFQFANHSKNSKIDFTKFKNLIHDLYNRDNKPLPNYNLLKIAYETLDLRKDGILDINEWGKAFGYFNGSLDMIKSYNNLGTVNNNNRRILREWECSYYDSVDIYKLISKHKKLIKEKLKVFCMGYNNKMCSINNLISVLKDVLPFTKLSNTQWRIIASNGFGVSTDDDIVDTIRFFEVVEDICKRSKSQRINAKY